MEKKSELPHEEKINYMRIAAGICGFGFSLEQMDLLVSNYELVTVMQGETTIVDMVKIQHDVKDREDARLKSEIERKTEVAKSTNA